MASEDYYSILGIDKQAPDREVKRAYYGLARDLHPDKAKSPEEARENAEKLAVISRAYNTLKDPKKRAEYDEKRPGSSSGNAPKNATTKIAPSAPSSGVRAQNEAQNSAPTAGKTGSAPGTGPGRLSANDIASQKILTAQKAFVKGMEFYKNAEYKKALPFFEAAVANDPESEPQYHVRLSNCLIKTKGSFSRAQACLEKACDMDQYNVEFKLALGELYETVGIDSKAKVTYENVLRWDPDNNKAKFRLSLLANKDSKKGNNILAKVFPSLFGKK